MLNILLPYIDQRLSVFQTNYGLAELVTEGSDENPKRYPAVYSGSDNYVPIEIEKAMSYHRINGSMNWEDIDDNTSGCSKAISIVYPMILVACIDRDAGCEQYSSDTISVGVSSLIEQVQYPKQIRAAIKAMSIRVNVKSINTDRNEVWAREYNNNGMPIHFDKVYFSINYDIVIKADSKCLNLLECPPVNPELPLTCSQISDIPLSKLSCLTPEQVDYILSLNMKPIVGTYADFESLKNNSLLLTGRQYEMTDYKTMWRIVGTSEIGEGPIAPIVLTASGENAFDPIVTQASNPHDIIEYDFDKNLCEDGTTPRPGMITSRLDTSTNSSCGYDYKVIQYYRYMLDTTVHLPFDPLNPYAINATVVHNDILWVSTFGSNLGHTPGNDNYWCKVMADVSTSYQLWAASIGMGNYTITADLTKKKLFYTFHDNSDDTLSANVRNTHIGKCDVFNFGSAATAPYNNIVIQVPSDASNIFIADNTFEEDCANFNFYTTTQGLLGNTFGQLSNIFLCRNMTNCTFWGRSAQVVTGLAANRFIGLFAQWVSGDNCQIISSQANQHCRLISTVVNVNIVNNMVGGIIATNVQRMVIERPVGTISILGNGINSGSHIGQHAGNYTLVTGRLGSTDTTIDLMITKTFTGAAGSGAIGSVTLDDIMAVPSGYRVDSVATRASGLTFGVGAILNMGYTGSTTAALDNTTGALTTLNSASIVKASPVGTESGSNNNVIVASVSGNSITAGRILFYIRLVKVTI